MKKTMLIFFALGIILSGCGVKSDLERSGDSPFPRNYPVD